MQQLGTSVLQTVQYATLGIVHHMANTNPNPNCNPGYWTTHRYANVQTGQVPEAVANYYVLIQNFSDVYFL